MLVRDLIQYMHPNEVVRIYVYKNTGSYTTFFEGKSLGNVGNLKIPEKVLNKEVDFYTMLHNIVTYKGKEENYEHLPYIELELVFRIAVF